MADQQNAVITVDCLLRALSRLAVARPAELAEVRRLLSEARAEVCDERGGKMDADDRRDGDVLGVVLLHLEAPGAVDVLGERAEYAHLCRKMSHGCYDATCPLCDAKE